MLIHEIINRIDKEKRISEIIKQSYPNTYQEKGPPEAPVAISIVIKFKGVYMLCNLSRVTSKFYVYTMCDEQNISFADPIWEVYECTEINTSTLIDNTKKFLEFLMTKDKEDI